jgi:hypothetical protein
VAGRKRFGYFGFGIAEFAGGRSESVPVSGFVGFADAEGVGKRVSAPVRAPQISGDKESSARMWAKGRRRQEKPSEM